MIEHYMNRLVPHERFWYANPDIYRDISTATPNWPQDHLIYNKDQGRFQIGGGSIPYSVGSAASDAKQWPTTSYFQDQVHSMSNRSMSDPILSPYEQP
jgi:hypothetical protein